MPKVRTCPICHISRIFSTYQLIAHVETHKTAQLGADPETGRGVRSGEQAARGARSADLHDRGKLPVQTHRH